MNVAAAHPIERGTLDQAVPERAYNPREKSHDRILSIILEIRDFRLIVNYFSGFIEVCNGHGS